jgi:RNA polymerase sigma factor (sigma-70 family)
LLRAVDDDEFDWLFRAHFASIVRTVYVIVYDRGRAEDVTQDAFAQLWRNWPTLRGYERPQEWVRRVAIRMAVRDIRRERLRPDLERRASYGVDDEVLPDPDLADAVWKLSPMQRAAVVLYYLEDRPIDEIADVLRVSDSTVKQHLFRARHRLADLLGEKVVGDVG